LATDAAGLAGLLADATRRKVFAALVLGDRTVEQMRESTGLTAREIVGAVVRLVDGELVVAGADGMYFVIEEAFTAAAREAAPARDADDGRLTAIPRQRSKRLVVLDRLAQEFEPGQHYSERQVNAILRRWNEDTAALRRYLVDEGFMERDHGEYWRAGGTYEP
jgi:hypothetical protein